MEHPTEAAPKPLRGMRIAIVKRPNGDFSNSGISAGRSYLTLVGEGIPEQTAVTESAPAAYLIQRALGGAVRPYISPAPDQPGRYIAGGAYAVLGDARINGLIDYYGAVPIHDRLEVA